MIYIKLECLNFYVNNFELTEYGTSAKAFKVAIPLVPVSASFTVDAILKILTIFLLKIICWHQMMIMLDEWEEHIELAGEVSSTSTSVTIVPLVAVLLGRLAKWCIKKDEKDPYVPRRRFDGSWASLPNKWRDEGLFKRGKLCFYLFSCIASKLIFLHISSAKLLIAAIINYMFSQPIADY